MSSCTQKILLISILIKDKALKYTKWSAISKCHEYFYVSFLAVFKKLLLYPFFVSAKAETVYFGPFFRSSLGFFTF